MYVEFYFYIYTRYLVPGSYFSYIVFYDMYLVYILAILATTIVA